MSKNIVYFIAGISQVQGDRVDRNNGVIKGVSVITGNVQARGHDLWTDEVTLEQMAERGKRQGKVLVKENHRKGGESTGVDAGVGWLQNFRVEGEHTRADLYLYPSHPKRDLYLDIAEKTPELMGLSAAFVPPEKPTVVDGKKRARVEELVTVDIVTQPAANPGGWFEAANTPDLVMVDNSRKAMPGETTPSNAPAKEPTLTDLLNAMNGLNERFSGIEQRLDAIESSNAEPPTAEELDELEGMSDAELQKHGITREDIAEARAQLAEIAEAAAAEQASEGDDKNAAQAAPAKGSEAAAPAAAAGAAFSALTKRLEMLERRIRSEDEAKAKAEVEAEFAAIEKQITELEAKNQALETALNAAGKGQPLTSSRDQIGFSVSDGGHKPGTFEHFVELEMKDAKGDRTVAMLSAIKKQPSAYDEYRKRLGITK